MARSAFPVWLFHPLLFASLPALSGCARADELHLGAQQRCAPTIPHPSPFAIRDSPFLSARHSPLAARHLSPFTIRYSLFAIRRIFHSLFAVFPRSIRSWAPTCGTWWAGEAGLPQRPDGGSGGACVVRRAIGWCMRRSDNDPGPIPLWHPAQVGARHAVPLLTQAAIETPVRWTQRGSRRAEPLRPLDT
jgi:hypothetical protein